MVRINAPLGVANIESDADRLAPLIMRHAGGGHSHDFDTRNVVTGSTAGTSGTDNVVIGYEAGAAVTSGLNNTVVGSRAGLALTSAGSNTLVGANAGRSITTASFTGQNTFIGSSAGRNNDAYYNTMVGTLAGYYNTSGNSNTYIGRGAGNGVNGETNNGSNNTGVGEAALTVITTGRSNTGVGRQAGRHVSSGVENVFIGASAGFYVTTGSNNVRIGYFAGYTDNSSNKLFIEAHSIPANVETTPLVYGEFDNRNLAFRTKNFGGGEGVFGIRNCIAAPSTNPASGGVLYVESGALKWKGSSGTVTTIANA